MNTRMNLLVVALAPSGLAFGGVATAEVAKLNKQYGEKNVTDFLNGMTYAVTDGLKLATLH